MLAQMLTNVSAPAGGQAEVDEQRGDEVRGGPRVGSARRRRAVELVEVLLSAGLLGARAHGPRKPRTEPPIPIIKSAE